MESLQGHINPFFLDRKADVRSLEVQGDKVPFLKMLQSEEEDISPFLSIKEPNFLALLSLQNIKEPSWELESYLSHEDSFQNEANQFLHNPISNQEEKRMIHSSSSSPKTRRKTRKTGSFLPQETGREKRKRRKTKPSKNIEEIENQRMNHIAVERNRRRQMNEHINSLRSLLPPSYIQRVDQASIVGGAISYVKVLEQIIQSLETQKRTKQSDNLLSGISSNTSWTEESVSKVEVIVIQNHVRLKVECEKRQGQLLKGIVSLEKLRLTVLHLNISSSSPFSVSYSFNLKMEEDCELESVEDITKVAYQIFDIRQLS